MDRLEVFRLPLRKGSRFCALHLPERAAVGALLHIHPFAEEMNKSRRMTALQARALAGAGWAVLRIDLFGCGDSDGEFEDATWSGWIDDVVDASEWLSNRYGLVPAFWGMRLGCLLAGEAARRMQSPRNFLLWQPVHSGRQFLQQFLRLKLANQLFQPDGEQIRTEDVRGRLERGETIEIGGYMLSPDIARGMDGSGLVPPLAPARTAWLDVVSTVGASPATTSRVQAWRDSGAQVDLRAVTGPPFWQTQELAECPELIGATLEAVESWRT